MDLGFKLLYPPFLLCIQLEYIGSRWSSSQACAMFKLHTGPRKVVSLDNSLE